MSKETLYIVDKTSGIILRTSKTLLSAVNFWATQHNAAICTADTQDQKKGDPIAFVNWTMEDVAA